MSVHITVMVIFLKPIYNMQQILICYNIIMIILQFLLYFPTSGEKNCKVDGAIVDLVQL